MLGAVLDFVFPPRCAGCGVEGACLCRACVEAAKPAPRSRCASCGRRVSVTPCPLCAHGAGACELVAAQLLEAAVREAVHRLKYGDRPQLAAPLAALTLAGLGGLAPGALVPVPLHARRRRRRGYNQAELIARELGRLTGRPLWLGLRRQRDTAPQVGRGGGDRRHGLDGAFVVVAEPPPVVVLLDDVLTTGATLLAASDALLAAGARRVAAVATALG